MSGRVRQFHRGRGRRFWFTAATVVASAAFAVVFVAASGANLAPSTFEGNDGNMVVDTAGHTDWVSLSGNPGLQTLVDLPSGSNDNAFGQGSKENDTNVTVVTGSIPPNKNDLTRSYLFNEQVSGTSFLYLAWERASNTGDAHIDFELNQNATPGFNGSTTGAVTLNRTKGDLLISYDFGGSGTPTITLQTWDGSQWNNSQNLSALGFAEAAVNTSALSDVLNGNASVGIGDFGEASVNLSDALVAAGFNPDTCAAFGSMMVKSRASGSSSNAELKDFIAPVPIHVSNCATPTISTTLSESSGFVGDSVHDNATLTGATSNAGGTVKYTVYTDNQCTQGARDAGTAAVTNGSVGQSNTLAFNTPGDFYWQAVYSGDNHNVGATSTCTSERLVITKRTPTVTTDVHNAGGIVTSAAIGSTVHDVATVSGAGGTPTGTVTFTLYSGNSTCSGNGTTSSPVTLSGGSASSGDATVPAGGLSYIAHYSGDSTYNAGDGPCEPLAPIKITPTVATTVHNAGGVVTSAPIGSTVHDVATVTGSQGTPTGTVTFTLYSGNSTCSGNGTTSSAVALSGGSASSGDATVPVGGLSYKAHYSGDGTYNAGDGPCEPLTATKLTPTVATDVHNAGGVVTSAPIGSTVHDVATVTGSVGTPTGTVTFTLYSGNSTCSGNGTTSGPVALSGGSASSGDATVPVGGLSYIAHYSGDNTYNPGDGPCEPLTATKLTPTVATDVHDANGVVTSAAVGSTVHDVATVTGSQGTPTGTVTFELFSGSSTCQGDSSTSAPVALSGGSASSGDATVPVGGLSYIAHYSGDNTYLAGDGPCEPIAPIKLTPTVATDVHNASGVVTSAPIGSTVHDVATVTGSQGTPTGTVTFTLYSGNSTCSGNGTTSSPVALSGGSASSGDATVPVGGLSYKAHYSGDDTYNSADGPCEPLMGTKLTPTVATDVHNADGVVISAPVGSTVHDVATVTGSQGTPTGTVTFELFSGSSTCQGDSSTSAPVTLSGGSASSGDATVPVDGLSYIAHYSGDDTYLAGDGPCEPLTAGNVTPTVTTDPGAGEVVVGATLNDTATLAGGVNTPQGSITFNLYGPDNPTCDSEGAAAVYTQTVSVDGNGDYMTSPGFTTTLAGTYNWTAAYSGDDGTGNNPASSQCGSETVQVDNPAISITKNPKTQSFTSGGTATFTITVTNTGDVTLTNVTVTDPLSPNCAKTIGTLDPGDSTTYTCSLANVTESFTNVATATGTPPVGPDVSDQDSASVTVHAAPQPPPPPQIDLAVTKVGGPNPQTVNKDITWTMVVTNNGPDAATGVTAGDPLPAGTTFVSVTSTQGTCTGGTMIQCSIGGMAAGATVTITLVTTAVQTGTLTNTVTVVGKEQETNTANNTASASVQVNGPFVPPKVVCSAVLASPKLLYVGRNATLTLHVTKAGKPASGVRIRITGPGLNMVTKPSNAKGVIKMKVKPKKAGIVRFTVVLPNKTCKVARVGITGVFTPPVTG